MKLTEVFNELNNINVNDKTEDKNGLTYLSWAWAWGELKKKFPLANYTIYENKDGWNYFTDGHTCWVKVGVTIITEHDQDDAPFRDYLEHIEYLPVMDYRNNSIPLDKVTSTDVNKAIQRALTKAIARHGLGLYIYAGEDLPEEESKEKELQAEHMKKISKKDADKLATILTDDQKAWIIGNYHVNTLQELNYEQYGKLMRQINERKK